MQQRSTICSFSCFLSLSFFLLAIATTSGLAPDDCPETKCGQNGPPIRFPFRVATSQPERCGFPGFDLSCSPGTNHTLISLNLATSSVQLLVKSINYTSQSISLSDPGSCLPNYARNFSSSHWNEKGGTFRYKTSYGTAIFSCPVTNSSGGTRDMDSKVACLSVPGSNDVYALGLYQDVSYLPLAGCTKMYTLQDVPDGLFLSNNISLYWDRPECRHCELNSMTCGYKHHKIGTKTKCFGGPPKHHTDTWKSIKIAGSVLGSLVLLVLLGALYWVYRADRKKKENQARIEKFLEDYKALKPTRYYYADLVRITGDFKEKLGQGAYGTVYKGTLSSEIFVAVKILENATFDGEEFINEVGTMGRIHHVNVVRMVGFCADGFRRALVYEFLPNESLEKFIFSDDGQKHPLGWEKLQDIALGIARGIEYLHQGCDQRILHFDIKPHNILLDEDLTPKISDFGLAKLCAKDQSAVSMTAARGTMGYIAPEVFSRNFGNVSHKSDVYSFGMLLLEMVGGRKNNDDKAEKASQVFFPEWIYKQLEQGQELDIRVVEGGDTKIATKLTIVALCCIQWYPRDRPSMNIVVQMLEGEGDDLVIPPNPFNGAGQNGLNGSLASRHPLNIPGIRNQNSARYRSRSPKPVGSGNAWPTDLTGLAVEVGPTVLFTFLYAVSSSSFSFLLLVRDLPSWLGRGGCGEDPANPEPSRAEPDASSERARARLILDTFLVMDSVKSKMTTQSKA